MNLQIIAFFIIFYFISISILYFFMNKKSNKDIGKYKKLSEALEQIEKKLFQSQNAFDKINLDTKDLQALKINESKISLDLKNNEYLLSKVTKDREKFDKELHDTMSRLDLYTRIDDFVEYGLFETPEYLHNTASSFFKEIKRVRDSQKNLIQYQEAILLPKMKDIKLLYQDQSYTNKVMQGQIKLMLNAFNIECDYLISKVSASSLLRVLERIEQLANKIEKNCITMKCGFNIDYIELKYEECKLQYQFKIKKQEEIEEQRAIKGLIKHLGQNPHEISFSV